MTRIGPIRIASGWCCSIAKPFNTHSGGTIRFDAEGQLFIAVGDGGEYGDPFDNAQNRFSLLGKMLRIDVDGGGPRQPYGIPADNPFAGQRPV